MRRPLESFPSWTPSHDARSSGAPQRQRRLEGREPHEAPAHGGVADRFLGHLYLTLFPADPSLCPPILASGQVTAFAVLPGTPSDLSSPHPSRTKPHKPGYTSLGFSPATQRILHETRTPSLLLLLYCCQGT